MSHYKPYAAYRNSGVECLGQVPAHWDVSRVKFTIVSIGQGWSPECESRAADGGEWGVLKVGCVNGGNFRSTENKALPTALRPRVELALRKGDILISRANTRELVGGCAVVDRDYPLLMICDKLYRLIVDDSRAIPDFLGALIIVHGRREVELEATGASASMVNIAQSVILNLQIGLPRPEEQTVIVEQLKRETARIDGLVSRKLRFIELLREKRQAMITHAVTKGLDPSAQMKDSGVEWLGEVPAHWEVCKLNFRYSVELGKMLDEKRITGISLLPYLRNQDVQWGAINTECLPEMDIHADEMERYTVKKGDLLVCEGGDVGRAAIWQGVNREVGFQKALHRLRTRSSTHDTAEFFYFSLLAAKEHGIFEQSDASATITHLPAEKFRQYRFAFPPLLEQLEITAQLTSRITRLDTLINATEHSMTLLKERRSALITATVTGQIDLRPQV